MDSLPESQPIDYAYGGHMEEARATANKVFRIKPNFYADHWGKVMPNKDPAVTCKNVKALKKAGLTLMLHKGLYDLHGFCSNCQ